MRDGKILGIRAGTGPHRFIGIWVVVVEGRGGDGRGLDVAITDQVGDRLALYRIVLDEEQAHYCVRPLTPSTRTV